ncbi:MAG: cytochrome C biosynthesis protein [Gemmatimonadetes bacterium]|nr:PD40 domain-containing protein [Gemmatimonadota bacterium]NNM06952.1 cytochrome C biosynthesis protein [Gemmatimonadota bacterium]
MRVPAILLALFLFTMPSPGGTPGGPPLGADGSPAKVAGWDLVRFASGEAPVGNVGSIDDQSGRISDQLDRVPRIEPDYVDVTIPPNVAPLNFIIREEASSFEVTATSGSGQFQLEVTSSNGVVRFPETSWRELLAESVGDTISLRVTASQGRGESSEVYLPFSMFVSSDEIDPWLVYRVIHPGYYSWSEIRIDQRSMESFEEEPVIQNRIMENNCANCHNFNQNSSDQFMIHVRGSLGGTYFVEDGEITRVDPKLDEMPAGATYPAWHPSGRYLAFSSNQVRQSFYSIPGKAVEVYDLDSSLILYDRTVNETLNIPGTGNATYLETFPSWSPDGEYLYFCRALQVIGFSDPQLDQIQRTHYDIVRRSFDPESRTFGEAEVVFNAVEIGKSASFPRISPDGRFLAITVADYGTFPIWHKEADLYLIDLDTGEQQRMEVNSEETESYHTWSSSGRWMVFSSKRLDGRTGRPFFTHIDPEGNQGKEFVLPQEDPSRYDWMLESFNIPELVDGKIEVDPRDFLKAAGDDPLKAGSGNPPGFSPFRPLPEQGPGVSRRAPHG